MEKIKQILEENKQGDLLEYKNINKEKVAEELLKVDFNQLNTLYKKAVKNEQAINKKIEPIKYIDKSNLLKEEKEKYEKIGEKIIQNNQYAVVTMAGGQRHKIRT